LIVRSLFNPFRVEVFGGSRPRVRRCATTLGYDMKRLWRKGLTSCAVRHSKLGTTEYTMKPSVYVETSIPSFYFEVRTEPKMIARRQWTREWWDNHFADYGIVTSVAVVDELERYQIGGKNAMILFPISPTRILCFEDLDEPENQYYPIASSVPTLVE